MLKMEGIKGNGKPSARLLLFLFLFKKKTIDNSWRRRDQLGRQFFLVRLSKVVYDLAKTAPAARRAWAERETFPCQKFRLSNVVYELAKTARAARCAWAEHVKNCVGVE